MHIYAIWDCIILHNFLNKEIIISFIRYNKGASPQRHSCILDGPLYISRNMWLDIPKIAHISSKQL